MPPVPPDPASARLSELEFAVSRARAALAWERLWPLLVPVLSVAALYVALSWLGLWRLTGDWTRIAILAGLGLAFLASLVPLLRFAAPTREEALRRVETVSGMRHRPASGLDDRLSPVSDDGPARVLWEAHRARLLAAITNPRAGLPRPEMVRRDPNALRFVLPVLLVVAAAVAWGEWGSRLREPFAPVTVAEAAPPARIDAWIDPPPYTRQPPVFLSRRAADDTGPVRVPEGSKLTVRLVAAGEPEVILEDANGANRLAEAEGDPARRAVPASAPSAAPAEGGRIRTYAAVLGTDAVVRVRHGKGETAYAIAVIDDRPPTIRRGDMAENRSGSFTLGFKVHDDYGVKDGNVTFRRASGVEGAHPLVEPPSVALRIGREQDGEADARADVRLEDHPYAGLDVLADALVRDGAGQEGRPADNGAMKLPARPFYNPLARALVEQRQILALDAREQDRVADALDALTLAPDVFTKDFGTYLALRVGYDRLVAASTDDELRGMLDYLWQVALAIESGEAADARQRLDAARDALEQALERGASDEEIARLTQELRQAMQDFMRSMAEEMARRGLDQMQSPIDPDTPMISQQDLDRMLDRIEDLAKLGDRESAQQLLSQLQQMLDNMQMAQQGQMQQMSPEAMQMLDELSKMMQEQQRLMDETFRMDQGRQPGHRGQQQQQGQGQQRPMTPEEMAELMKQLQQGQADLQKQMQALLDRMRRGQQAQQGQDGQGMQPGEGEGEGQRALGRAGRAMGDAARQLGQGSTGPAYGSQGEALEAMRQGMQGMMQQMMGNNGQPGQEGGPGQQFGRGMPRGRTDPLGRPQRTQGPDFGDSVEVPDEIDVERARRILNAIRERLGERFRPGFELDYLERLLGTQ
ncbi:TIGR02302 family protein [Propylenella binzhouense]|uniref:TIGR02302 family protein n=1 Tax=Propylenella binzhouense TaxID=2555902 RepID=A0A964WV95_9HYPH|nr:TIGR02302 family protein [Propylenella binzhouense]MYZ49941.1 TIGR02302 family protein [Propylenella binzhouense]